MGKNILAVVLGLITGMISMMLLQKLGHTLFPPPEGMDPNDVESIAAHMHELPVGAMLMVIFSHLVGTLLGGAVVGKIALSHHVRLSLIIGGFFMIGGIMMLTMIPHPWWFKLELLGYIPAAYLGCKMTMGR